MTPPAPVSSGLPAEWSHKAIFGAIFGLLGFATLWLGFGLLFAAMAAVLGHVARHETSARPLRGRGFATFGLWLGYGAMLVFPFLILLAAAAVPALGLWRSDEDVRHQAESRTQASRLFVACEAYARANRDRYPASWENLSGRFVTSGELDELLRSPHAGGLRTAFELVPHDRPVLPAIADSVVVIQELAPPQVREIAVVYADGSVSALHNPAHDSP